MARDLHPDTLAAITGSEYARFVGDPWLFDSWPVTFDSTAFTFDADFEIVTEVTADVKWAAFCRFDFDSGTFAFGSVFQDTVIDGVTYVAAGDLGNVAPLTESTDSQPQDFEVTIGGIDLSLVSLYLSEPYLGRPAYVYYAVIDEKQKIIGAPILAFYGGMQEIAIVDGQVPTISITGSNELADWNRPRPARYTDAEHQAFVKRRIKDGTLPAGFEDRGFEFVPQMENREVIWPAKSWFV